MLEVRRLALTGVVEINPRRFRDARGYFSETWSQPALAAAGIEIDFVQDNQSLSLEAGTVRGLHYQAAPLAQDKLIRVLAGSIFDVAVDLRPSSPTFGQWVSLVLSAKIGNQLLVPRGFAHGWTPTMAWACTTMSLPMTLEPDTLVTYKVSAPYSAAHERSIHFADPTLAIAWPRTSADTPILSDKDAHAPLFTPLALEAVSIAPNPLQTVLVTGGAGFIGSAVCRELARLGGYRIVNVDSLTYAGNLASLRDLAAHPDYVFYHADIRDEAVLLGIMERERVNAVMHLAAESHVDRSIDAPLEFVDTNVVGTVHLLNAALRYWRGLESRARDRFRFHHISTDEVFGDLPFDSGVFTEATPYAPSSPYSASKAASDHFVRAWHETYGLPIVLTNCSNNYGPYHFPEKLIPLTILNALSGRQLPVYGKGTNVRDWLHVEDHARALIAVLGRGRIGETYVVGGRAERTNLAVVEAICDAVDELSGGRQPSMRRLISFVADRPGHDRRYAIDPTRIETELGWRAIETFDSGIRKTVAWYVANRWWWEPLRAERYDGQRLGLTP